MPTAKHRARVYICALDREICHVKKMENWDIKLLEMVFLHFTKIIMDGKSFTKLLSTQKVKKF